MTTSSTLARLQAEHPGYCWTCGKRTADAHTCYEWEVLKVIKSAVTDLDRQLAERDEENTALHKLLDAQAKELAQWQDQSKHYAAKVQEAQQENARLREQLAEAHNALRRVYGDLLAYGKHLSICEALKERLGACNCGLRAAVDLAVLARQEQRRKERE